LNKAEQSNEQKTLLTVNRKIGGGTRSDSQTGEIGWGSTEAEEQAKERWDYLLEKKANVKRGWGNCLKKREPKDLHQDHF